MAAESEKIRNALAMLSSFEEEMANFYSEMARLCTTSGEFWESAALVKTTRSNLYANISQDFGSNLNSYILQRDVSGTFINLLNKVKTRRTHLAGETLRPETTGVFVKDVETATITTGVMPVVVGQTLIFEKIDRILTQTQSNQVRLIEGFLRSNSGCHR